MTEVNGPVSPHVAEPQIAMFCGRQLLHMNTESGQWEADPQGRQGCFTQPSKILSYCQEVIFYSIYSVLFYSILLCVFFFVCLCSVLIYLFWFGFLLFILFVFTLFLPICLVSCGLFVCLL